jgi:hypothetical protein
MRFPAPPHAARGRICKLPLPEPIYTTLCRPAWPLAPLRGVNPAPLVVRYLYRNISALHPRLTSAEERLHPESLYREEIPAP